MEPNKIIQNTCLPKINSQVRCLQTDQPTPEEIPQPDKVEFMVERENDPSPYFHREIF